MNGSLLAVMHTVVQSVARDVPNKALYIGLAWGVTFAAIGLYALWVLRRGRELTPRVPESERRWMTARSGRARSGGSGEEDS